MGERPCEVENTDDSQDLGHLLLATGSPAPETIGDGFESMSLNLQNMLNGQQCL